MKITMIDTVLEGGEVRTTANIVIGLEEFEKIAATEYDKKRILTERIAKKVASEIADEYLEKNRALILEAVDIDQVIKGIQFKAINDFAKPGHIG
jgi:hypothetical protein